MNNRKTFPGNDKEVELAASLAVKKAKTVTDDPVDQAREIIQERLWFKLFVIVSSLTAFGEAVLIGFSPINFNTNGFYFYFQLYVLIGATILFWIGVLATAAAMYEIPPEKLKEPLVSFADNIIQTFDGEVLIEFSCLLFGWITIFILPGLSTLRCFRLFRFFWYFELFSKSEGNYVYRMLVKSVHLLIQSLEKIGDELFSTKSKGGVVVLGLFFFVSYLFAVVFHTSMGHLVTLEGQTCYTLKNCFIVMLRLVFYDGTGFDYMNALVDQGYSGWALLIICYMCFGAMILLNGLVGIFGIAFQNDDDDDSDNESEKDDKEINEETVVRPFDYEKPITSRKSSKSKKQGLTSDGIENILRELQEDIKNIKRNVDELRFIEESKKKNTKSL